MEQENEYLFGLRSILEALAAGRSLDKVWMEADLSSPVAQELRAQLKAKNIALQLVPPQKLESLARQRNHQGAVAFVSPIVYHPLEERILAVIAAKRVPLFVLLDGVTDVRNMGAIARTAECMGVDALILPMQSTAPINADAIKTSAGALNHLPVCRVGNAKLAIALLKAYGIHIVALTEKAEAPINQLDARQPLCLLLGDEGMGIAPAVLALTDQLVRIPMAGKIASLNVSVAAGMVLYETRRQRDVV